MDGKPHIRRTTVAPFLSLFLSLFLFFAGQTTTLFLAATSIADTSEGNAIAGQTTSARSAGLKAP